MYTQKSLIGLQLIWLSQKGYFFLYNENKITYFFKSRWFIWPQNQRFWLKNGCFCRPQFANRGRFPSLGTSMVYVLVGSGRLGTASIWLGPAGLLTDRESVPAILFQWGCSCVEQSSIECYQEAYLRTGVTWPFTIILGPLSLVLSKCSNSSGIHTNWRQFAGGSMSTECIIECPYLFTPDAMGPFCWHGLTWIETWISNHMPSKVWDENNYLSLLWLKLNHVSKRGQSFA